MDRIAAFLSYYTIGMFGLIWIIFSHFTNRKVNSFLSFNIYQSIFVSVFLAVISMIYGIALNFVSVVPIIGKLIVSLDIYINQTPMYASFTLCGFVLTVFLSYLAILSLLGKKPYVPYISNIIGSNFRG